MKLASYLESQHFKTAASFVVKRTGIIGLFVYAIAIAGFFVLPRDDIGRSIYIDENALMSGLAKRLFGDAATINKLASALRVSVQSEAILVVEEELSKLGLEVYQQNYSALPPIALDQQRAPKISGRNVYGVLRAPRASTTEAIILSAPFQTRDGTNNIYGIALMLSLANYFKTKNYWAKDLVFLVTSDGEIGMEAWVDSYMGQQTPGIVAGSLQGHSGAIQAVFNLEIGSPTFEYVELVVGGTNGILPNLDMVNVVTRLCMTEGIQTTFHAPHFSSFLYQQSLKALLLFGARLAPGLPTGNHALFLSHRIDAITIRGVGKTQDKQNIVPLGRAMEGIIRSFNNLLETLHHSLYFYLLPTTWTFVSIAVYSPPFGLFLLPLALEALKQWLVARTPDIVCPTQASTVLAVPKETPFPFSRVFGLLLASYGSGGLLCYLPGLACASLGPITTSGLLVGLLSICGVSVLVPLLMGATIGDPEWRIVKCVNLLLLIIMLAAFAVLNYPLAICLGLGLSIPCIVAQPSCLSLWHTHRLVRASLLLLLSPPMWAWYFCTLYCVLLSGPTADIHDVITASIAMVTTGVASAYNGWHMFGCWLYWAVCACVWPLWMMAWCLTCQRVEATPPRDDSPTSHTPTEGDLQGGGDGKEDPQDCRPSKNSQLFTETSPSHHSHSTVEDSPTSLR